MNTEQLIREEAERMYPILKDHNLWQDEIAFRKEKQNAFKHGATFGASLNGWVSVNDRLPTDDDADDDQHVEAWQTEYEESVTVNWLLVTEYGIYSHWRRIVKP